MATYSLDQLRADVEKAYAGITIEVGDDKIALPNILRLSDSDRNKIVDHLEKLGEASEENDFTAIAKHSTAVLKIAAGKRGADLVKLLGDDVALTLSVLRKWTEQTQAGEADSSQS